MHKTDAFKQNANHDYNHSEKFAIKYFQTLSEQIINKSYIHILTSDLKEWQKQHTKKNIFSILNFMRKKEPSQNDYYRYIDWMRTTGKLDMYLHRSVSYIYMRDLGRTLDDATTKTSIQNAINRIKENFQNAKEKNGESQELNMLWLYKKAKAFGVETTFIWLLEKLNKVEQNIPKQMDAEQARRKLLKLIVGVLMHEMDRIREAPCKKERTKIVEKSIRLGYAYGLTYPFIDDLLDAKILSESEEELYSSFIRQTLLTGEVAPFEGWHGENKAFIQFVYSELSEAFEYMHNHQTAQNQSNFLTYAYIFFKAQEQDRKKDLKNPAYTNEEIYIPIILKAAYSRLIIRSIIQAPKDEDIEKRIFYYGLYNQLADDFTDMFEDMKNESVTPYTYYMQYKQVRPDLINPFELYWVVVSYLIHEVYASDTHTCEIILCRIINGLKRFKTRMGKEKYEEIMQTFALSDPSLAEIIQYCVTNGTDIEFFDKLLRDHSLGSLRKQKAEQEHFFQNTKSVRTKIDALLPIPQASNHSVMQDYMINAANYSLQSGGKRLRSIIAWTMAVDEYNLDGQAIQPILKTLEYMHTSSLILDDLPSQDAADTRRGNPTLHHVYNVAIAELASVFLMQKAIEEETNLEAFPTKNVLQVVRYCAQKTTDMCRGQAMDLNAKERNLSLDELNLMCFYKTGIAFEVSLVIPAILAGREEQEIEILKRFAHHAGIAFQIKDDLLDVEGNAELLGKSIGKDEENARSTFVSILSIDGAKREMWEHYCLAMDALNERKWKTPFMKHLLHYIINRES